MIPRQSKFFTRLTLMTGLLAGQVVIATAAPKESSFALVPGIVNLAVLPDTQYYAIYDGNVFNAQTQWIADNAARLGIAMTLHLGDIVDRSNMPHAWKNADLAMGILEKAGIPYAILPGNHDLSNSSQWDDARTPEKEPFLTTFSPTRASRISTFGGRDPKGYSEYHIFESQGQKFLVLSLGWKSSASTLEWAKKVMAKHRLPTILTSHEVLGVQPDEISPPLWTELGEYLWKNLIEDNDQIFLAIGGHFNGSSEDIRKNSKGNPVLMMVVDYQELFRGGNGHMLFLQLDVVNNKIRGTEFSPWVMLLAKKGEALTPFDHVQPSGMRQNFVTDFNLTERIGGILGKPPEYPAPSPDQVDAMALLKNDIAATPKAPERVLVPAAANNQDYVQVKETLAHWRFDKQAPGAVPVNKPLSLDIASGKNTLTRVNLGTPAPKTLVFSQDASPASASRGSICSSGGGRNGKPGAYLVTQAGTPLSREEFPKGYTIEAFFKLSPSFNEKNDRWSGLLARIETGAEVNRTDDDPLEPAQSLDVSNGNEIHWAGYPANRTDMASSWSWSVKRDQWHHVAAINDGQSIKIYIDGIADFRNSDAKGALGIAASQAGAGWMVGATHYDHEPHIFNGCIGEIRISGRALAPRELLFNRR